MEPFSVIYRGYEVDYNGSATFNVYVDGRNIDCFTNHANSNAEALDAIIDYIDEVSPDWDNHGELL